VFRQDSNTTNQRWKRRAASSGISVLKLDDTWAYARYREAGGGQDVGVAEGTGPGVILDLDTNDEQDSGFSRSVGTITLTNAGHYLVAYNIGIQVSAARRYNHVAAVFLDGTEVEGTRTTSYNRGQSGDYKGGLSYIGIINAAASDELTIRVWQDEIEGGYSDGTVRNDSTAVTLVKLPDTAEYIRLHESGGGQNLSTSEASITFDTDDEVDSAFDRPSGNPDEIKTLTADDYLFTWSVFARKPATNIYREHIWTKLKQTSPSTEAYEWASAGKYIRGDDSANNAPSGGASVGAIIEASANDVFKLFQQNEARDGNAVMVGDQYAIQGVRIGSLFSSNSAPDTPNIDNLQNGTCTSDTTPTLQFDLDDQDSGDTVKYQVQVDDEATFTSPYNFDFTEGTGSTAPRNDVTKETST
jgi:hypothetical protein